MPSTGSRPSGSRSKRPAPPVVLGPADAHRQRVLQPQQPPHDHRPVRPRAARATTSRYRPGLDRPAVRPVGRDPLHQRHGVCARSRRGWSGWTGRRHARNLRVRVRALRLSCRRHRRRHRRACVPARVRCPCCWPSWCGSSSESRGRAARCSTCTSGRRSGSCRRSRRASCGSRWSTSPSTPSTRRRSGRPVASQLAAVLRTRPASVASRTSVRRTGTGSDRAMRSLFPKSARECTDCSGVARPKIDLPTQHGPRTPARSRRRTAPARPTITAVRPFRIEVPEADLADLRDRLARTRWPEPATVGGWTQGVPLDYARDLCEYWRDALRLAPLRGRAQRAPAVPHRARRRRRRRRRRALPARPLAARRRAAAAADPRLARLGRGVPRRRRRAHRPAGPGRRLPPRDARRCPATGSAASPRAPAGASSASRWRGRS